MKKKLLMAMLSAMVTFSLVACGEAKTEEVVSENEAEETVSEDEAVSDNEVAEEVVEEEPVILPYCEEQNYKTTTQTAYNIPYVAHFVNDEGTDLADDPIYSLDVSNGCNVDVTNITVAPAEEDGYVDIAIESAASATLTLVYHADQDTEGTGRSCYPFNYTFPGYWIADYYTGQIAPEKQTFGDESFEYTYNVKWDGNTYPVTVSYSIEWTSGKWSKWANNADNTSSSSIDTANVKVIKVHMPKDYDGLVLYNSAKGPEKISFESDSEEDVDTDTIYYLCQPDKDGFVIAPEDLILIRVNDLLPEDAFADAEVSENAVSEDVVTEE